MKPKGVKLCCHGPVGTTELVLYREVKCTVSFIQSVLYREVKCNVSFKRGLHCNNYFA